MVGFLTPVGVVVGLVAVAMGLPKGSPILLDGRLAAGLIVVVAAAVALLGPGAFSVAARLFGRREISIPRSNDDR